MPFRNIFPLVCLVVAFLLPCLSHAQEARFLSLIDGDSMKVEFGGRSHEVRLIGIDAPEYGQEYSSKAKAYALNFCYGRKLRLEFDKERTDRYGRTLAYVYCGDSMLNREMLRAGMAIAIAVKPNTKHYKSFKATEKQARLERRGFWLHGGLKQTPAQWRKEHRR